jgi:hypothetical protein
MLTLSIFHVEEPAVLVPVTRADFFRQVNGVFTASPRDGARILRVRIDCIHYANPVFAEGGAVSGEKTVMYVPEADSCSCSDTILVVAREWTGLSDCLYWACVRALALHHGDPLVRLLLEHELGRRGESC